MVLNHTQVAARFVLPLLEHKEILVGEEVVTFDEGIPRVLQLGLDCLGRELVGRSAVGRRTKIHDGHPSARFHLFLEPS